MTDDQHKIEELKDKIEELEKEATELIEEHKRLNEAYGALEEISQYNVEVDNLYDQLKMEELKRLFECCSLEVLELL